MLDHIGLKVSDLARALAFYDRALAPLGLARVMSFGGDADLPAGAGYGRDGKPAFWISAGAPVSGPLHVAFVAADRAAVDAFHAAALAAGGATTAPPASDRTTIRATTPPSPSIPTTTISRPSPIAADPHRARPPKMRAKSA